MELRERVSSKMILDNILVLFVISGALIYIFPETLRQLLSLTYIEEYSYITVALLVSLAILSLEASKHVPLTQLRLGNLFTSMVFLSSSMMFFILSKIVLYYSLTLSVISMILLIWGFFIISYERRELRDMIIPLISILLVVPLPRDFMDKISLHLTRIVAYASSIISGAHMVTKEGGRVYLVIGEGPGKAMFEVITACSGIISVTSFIALLPLFIYVTRHLPLRRRLKALLISVFIGLVIVFLGNIIRVSLVLLVASHYSIETSYKFFHSTPSYIYSSLASIVSVYLLIKIAGVGKDKKNYINGKSNTAYNKNIPNKRGEGSQVAIAAAVIFTIIVFTSYLGPIAYSFNLNIREESLYTYDYAVRHTLSLIINTSKADILAENPVPALERALGSSVVKRITLKYNNTIYQGYVELGETTVRFHGWWVCLTAQGYKVGKIWQEMSHNLVMTFIEYSRNQRRYLLVYTIIETPLLVGNKTVDTGYIRLSLFFPVSSSILDKVELAKKLFSDIIRRDIATKAESRYNLFDKVSLLVMAFVSLTAGYYTIVFIVTSLYSTIKKIPYLKDLRRINVLDKRKERRV